MRKFGLLVAIAVLTLAVPVVGLGQENGYLGVPEQQAMEDTVQYALENNPVNKTSDWVNPDTGHAGTVTPVQTYENASRQPCREFITTIVVGGREEQGYGTACRQPDGSWQIASPQAAQSQSVPSTAVKAVPAATYASAWYGYPIRYYSGYSYPAGYYVYPAGYYGSSRIFFSFNYIYRGGHRHYGSWYLDGRNFRHRHPVTIHKRVYIGPRFYDRHFRHYRSFDRHRGSDRHRGFDRHDWRGHGDRHKGRSGVWRDPGHGGRGRHR